MAIGEFAAATQLSPKALRLYDEQGFLLPAQIDTANGYRYYRSDQVHSGRLIRTLREMGLPLADISIVVAADNLKAEQVLRRLAKEQERRHAREKLAFYSALKALRQVTISDIPEVVERVRSEQSVATRTFAATRHEFVERFQIERLELKRLLEKSGIAVTGAVRCALVDPLSEENGQLEVIAPVVVAGQGPQSVSLRTVSAARCAVMTIENRHSHASDMVAALDAMFDWFDRRTLRAVEVPLVKIERDVGLIEIEWPYEAA
jgi:DNA-binding transcriptional MerR regulator